jgi:hypothetical protein
LEKEPILLWTPLFGYLEEKKRALFTKLIVEGGKKFIKEEIVVIKKMI